jgi:hypothetical protein
MAETTRFALPLLEAAQAQKHVTMNEALARADALAAGRVERLGALAPPADPSDGEMWGVGQGATGAWTGQDGRLALFLNGGWDFAEPFEGQQVWDAATGLSATRLAGQWVMGSVAATPGAAATRAVAAEIDHEISPGASSTTAAVIPDKAVVIGITGRVIAAIGGADSWSLGVPGAPQRYGSGFGTTAGAFARGVTANPQAYFGGTPLTLSAAGGDFTGGTVRLAVHFLAIDPPVAV